MEFCIFCANRVYKGSQRDSIKASYGFGVQSIRDAFGWRF